MRLFVFATEAEAAPLRAARPDLHIRICGVGAVECALNVAKIIESEAAKQIILCGIAGAYSKELSIGEVVAVTTERTSTLPALYQESYQATLSLPLKAVVSNTTMSVGAAADGADIENMEGAALFAICNHYGVACGEIRAISNYTDQSRESWDIQGALSALVSAIEDIYPAPMTLAISPCPNDTFAFDALINGRIEHNFALDVEYKDIEELNMGVLESLPDISKISYSVYPKIAQHYALLDSGSALGRGNGQLLVRRKGESSPIRTVASPGLNTTANALLVRYFPEVEHIVPMLFSDIAEAVERGDVDAGVLIHEGRFVYHRRNLELVADLGKLWEAQTSLPLPLGAIVIKRSVAPHIRERFERLLAASVRYAFDNPADSREFVKAHAQELEDEVIDKHISLFVNPFTISLGEEGRRAVAALTGCELL